MNEDEMREVLEVAVVASVGPQVPPGLVWNLDKVTGALLPTVRGIVACELRAIYDEHRGGSGDMPDVSVLLDRADALSPASPPS